MYVQNLHAMEAQVPPSLPQFSTPGYVHRSHHGEGDPGEISNEPSESCVSASTGESRSGGEMRCVTLDANLASLCDHIHMEGFNSGVFSDVILNTEHSTYRLHRLIISRSSYFRNMLVGPWREANSPVLTLHVDDKNVNGEAIEIALAYLYGRYPKLNNDTAFRVLAAASFLDLQDLCSICTDFIISKLCSSNFLTYQVFAESQDYGVHGERVRNACWGYLCQSGFQELKEVLPKLSPQTLHALLTSDELWVPCEEKRFELALYALLAKGAYSMADHNEQGNADEVTGGYSNPVEVKIQHLADGSTISMLETKQGHPKSRNEREGLNTTKTIIENGNIILDYSGVAENVPISYRESSFDSGIISNIDQASADTCFAHTSASSFHSNAQIVHQIVRSSGSALSSEGTSSEDLCNHSKNSWPPGDQLHSSSPNPSPNVVMPSVWERSSMSTPTWGGRTVSKRELKACLNRNCDMSREYYDAFVNIFEGGSLLYCNMSFDALLSIKKRLEELGFPCKAVDAGLWLKMLLSRRVHDIGELTCKNCCLASTACTCRQPFGYSRGVTALSGSYVQDHELINLPHDIGHVYITNPAQGERNGLFRPARVHLRGTADGLAGIGRGTTYVPTAAWPPTRYVFSRVPFGIGNRSNQQNPANDNPENIAENQGDLGEGGLTALVGLNQGFTGFFNVHEMQTGNSFETCSQTTVSASLSPGPSSSGISVEVIDSTENIAGTEWESVGSSISLDLKTPLNHFPPFRFAAEFPDVERLTDGVVKHSPEFFYGGSLWKISVQAFSDEDPQGRRSLGLFLHRRKADISDQHRHVPMYTDAREKVTARYQLICPSKREVMIFGSYKQTGTLLPKAPKGWGWRTALLFNEFGDLLQNGALRVAAVVQLI